MRISFCAALALCLAVQPVRADDRDYLPNNFQIYISLDVAAVVKHQAIVDLKKRLPVIEQKFDAEMLEHIGVAPKDIVRLTMGVQMGFDDPTGVYHGDVGIGVLTLNKATTWAEIKAKFKTPKFKTDVSFEEMKVGAYTIYQEKFKYSFGGKPDEKFNTGQFFCLPKDNVLIFGSKEAVKVLERGTPPQISPAMADAIKSADPTSTAVIALDLKNMPERERKSMKREIMLPGFEEAIDQVNAAILQGKLGEKLQVTATALCKDDAGAVAVKKVADEGMAAVKFMLGATDKLPPPVVDVMKEAAKVVATIKTSTAGNLAKAEVALEPALAIRLIEMSLAVEMRPDSPAETPRPKVVDEKK